jgi:hypothetical protein
VDRQTESFLVVFARSARQCKRFAAWPRPKNENLALYERHEARIPGAARRLGMFRPPRTGQRSRKPGPEDWLPKGGRELSPERNLPDRR